MRQLSEPHEIPQEEITAGHVTNEPQLYDNSTFEQQETRHAGQSYGQTDIHSQRQNPDEAVTAANAAVEQEVLKQSDPQAEVDSVSNAAEDGHVHEEQHAGEPVAASSGVTEPTQVFRASVCAVLPCEQFCCASLLEH